MFSMRVRIGESAVEHRVGVGDELLDVVRAIGVFQPGPVPQAISLPLSISNGMADERRTGERGRGEEDDGGEGERVSECNVFMCQ